MKKSENPLFSIYWKIESGEAISSEEHALWVQNPEEGRAIKEMVEKFKEEVLFFFQSEREKEAGTARFEERLKEEIPEVATVPPLRSIWRSLWVKSAAAILVLCCAGILYLYRSGGDKSVSMFPRELDAGMQPGEREVVVIQADGTRVGWEQLKGGEVRKQGDMEMLKDSGKLIYRRVNSMQERSTDSFNIIQVPYGKQFTVRLADQTEVILNAGSCTKFSLQSEDTTRTVEILGEAMFNVAHDPTKPFRVNAAGMQVEALGTSFSVQAYKGQEDKKVTLVDGNINIISGNIKQPVIRPMVYIANSKGIFPAPEKAQVVKEAVLRSQGMFYYENSTLSEIIPELLRWYRLELADSMALDTSYHFHVDPTPRSLPINSIVEILEGTKEVEITITGNKMKVSSKKK